MKRSFKRLREELGKMKGFWFSKHVNVVARRAAELIDQSDPDDLKIEEIDSPIENITAVIFESSKLMKSEGIFIDEIIECVRHKVFTGPAFTRMMGLFTDIALSINVIQATKLLQYGTTGIVDHFPDIEHISIFFSFSLALLARPEPSVSETAFATFQQMMAIVMDAIQSYEIVDDNTQMKKCMSDCEKMFPGVFEKMKNPLHVILFLVFNDLCLISEKKKPSLLREVTCEQEQILEALVEVVNSYGSIMVTEPDMSNALRVKAGAVEDGLIGVNFAISAVIALRDDATFVQSVCRRFFAKLQLQGPDLLFPLCFFHIMALHGDMEIVFFTSDEVRSMFVVIFSTLVDILEPLNAPVKFMMRPWRQSEIMAQPDVFRAVAIVEIAMAAVSVLDTDNGSCCVARVVNAMIALIIYGLKYSAMSCFENVSGYMHRFLVVLSRNDLIGRADTLFRNVFERNGACQACEIDEKMRAWPKILGEIISKSPEIFENRWGGIIEMLVASGLSASFACKYSNITTMDVLLALVDMQPFPCDFIVGFLVANVWRFVLLWPIVETRIRDMKLGVADLLVFYKSMVNEGFDVETEVELLRLAAYIMTSESDTSTKLEVLEPLREIGRTSWADVREGWSSLFEAVSPENLGDDQELMLMAFQIFSSINFLLVDANFIADYHDTVFRFTAQKCDDDIAGESLRLIDKTLKRVDDWVRLFDKMTVLLSDPRLPVALKTLSTMSRIFSHLLDNGILAKQTIGVFIENKFPKTIVDLDDNSEIQHAMLRDLAKILCANWSQFKEWREFESTVVPLVIQRFESATTNFVPFYMCFYRCRFVTPSIELLLRRSIASRIPLINRPDADTALLKEFGRLLSVIVLGADVKISLRHWILILERIALHGQPADATEISPAIQKPFSSLPSLFPIERGPAVEIVQFLSNVVINTRSILLRNFVVDVMSLIIGKCRYLVFECMSVFSLPESDPLLPELLEARVDNESTAFDCCTLVIKRKPEAFYDQVMDKVVDLLPYIDNEQQKRFIMSQHLDVGVTMRIWRSYFMKSSPDYEELFFEDCFGTSVQAINALILEWTDNEETLVAFIDFLSEFEVANSEEHWCRDVLQEPLRKLAVNYSSSIVIVEKINDLLS